MQHARSRALFSLEMPIARHKRPATHPGKSRGNTNEGLHHIGANPIGFSECMTLQVYTYEASSGRPAPHAGKRSGSPGLSLSGNDWRLYARTNSD